MFTLADLSRMAVGDGWERYIMARLPDDTEKPVPFGEFNSQTMTPLGAPYRDASPAKDRRRA